MSAHFLEQLCPLRHRWPSAAMHERVINRLVGAKVLVLVQEAATGDTGHQFCLSQLFVRVTLDSSLQRRKRRSNPALHGFSYFWIALMTSRAAASATGRKFAKSA